jgi:hypothetical protein
MNTLVGNIDIIWDGGWLFTPDYPLEQMGLPYVYVH